MNNNFTKLTIIVIAILLILIVVFVYLGSLKRNHVRDIRITGGVETADFTNTKIDIKFSRPLKRENIANYISFEPTLVFKTSFIQNDLQITITQNLESNQDYKLKLSRDIEDVYGEFMESEYIFNFKTREEIVVFIKKGLNGDNDKVVQSNKSFEDQRILFESKNIKSYKKDGVQLLVVIVNENKTENIVVKNLESNSIQDFNLADQTIISADLHGGNVLFIAQKVEAREKFLAPQGNSTINVYNLSTKELKLFNPKNTGVNALYARFAPDGQNILYKGQDSFFYIADLTEDSEPVGIGRFKTVGGFNKSLNKIVFTEFDPLETYSSFPFITIFTSERKTLQVTKGEKYVQDPKFMNTSDSIIYSENFKEMEMTTGLFRIVKYDGENYEELFKDELNSYEFPKVNNNDRYLMVERYTPFDLLDFENQRSYIDFRKPMYGDLLIFDLQEKKILGTCENCIEGEFSW